MKEKILKHKKLLIIVGIFIILFLIFGKDIFSPKAMFVRFTQYYEKEYITKSDFNNLYEDFEKCIDIALEVEGKYNKTNEKRYVIGIAYDDAKNYIELEDLYNYGSKEQKIKITNNQKSNIKKIYNYFLQQDMGINNIVVSKDFVRFNIYGEEYQIVYSRNGKKPAGYGDGYDKYIDYFYIKKLKKNWYSVTGT